MIVRSPGTNPSADNFEQRTGSALSRRTLTGVFVPLSNIPTAGKVSMAQSYKALKEDFVSNLSGGEVSEVNYVTAVAPVCSIGILSLLELIGKSL